MRNWIPDVTEIGSTLTIHSIKEADLTSVGWKINLSTQFVKREHRYCLTLFTIPSSM